MTLTVDYLAFAVGASPNVVDQASWLASQSGSGIVADGFQTGIAQSNYFNKGFRQSSMVAAAIANFISVQLNTNVLDDGNLSNLVTLFTEAIQASGNLGVPTRIVTSSANFSFNSTDYFVGLNRTVGAAAMDIQIPTGMPTDKVFAVEDLVGNADTAPYRILPPAGHTIAGLANYKSSAARQWTEVRYYGSNIWSVRSGTP